MSVVLFRGGGRWFIPSMSSDSGRKPIQNLQVKKKFTQTTIPFLADEWISCSFVALTRRVFVQTFIIFLVIIWFQKETHSVLTIQICCCCYDDNYYFCFSNDKKDILYFLYFQNNKYIITFYHTWNCYLSNNTFLILTMLAQKTKNKCNLYILLLYIDTSILCTVVTYLTKTIFIFISMSNNISLILHNNFKYNKTIKYLKY